MDQAEAFGKLIAAARHWVKLRLQLKRLLDSKSAKPEDVKKAQQLGAAASAQLERAVLDFDRIVQMPPKRPKKPIDWVKVFGAISNVAGGIEKAAQSRQADVIEAQVIDTDGHRVR